MTEERSHRELRVLQGPQAGSRLALSVGDYLLGNADACTVILSGPRMLGEHALLEVAEEGLSLLPREGPVRRATGAEVDAEGEPLELGDAVELGGTWICVDDSDSPWPGAEALANLGLAQAPAATAPAKEDAVDEAPEGAKPDAAETAAESRRTGRRWLVALALGGMAAVSACGLAWQLLSEEEPEAPPARHEPAADPLPALLRKMDPARRLTAEHTARGGWKVSGYVKTAAERDKLLAALGALVPRPETAVFAEDRISAQAADMLSGQSFGSLARLRVETAGPGVLRLAGAARDASLVDAAGVAIVRGVPGVKGVESSVLFPDALAPILRRRLAEADLSESLEVLSDRPEFVVGGTVAEAVVARWDKLREDFRREFADALPIRSSFSRPLPRLPFKVKTVVGGAVPYVMTEDGEHVARGGRLAGMTLSSIAENQVVFEAKPQQTITVPR